MLLLEAGRVSSAEQFDRTDLLSTLYFKTNKMITGIQERIKYFFNFKINKNKRLINSSIKYVIVINAINRT